MAGQSAKARGELLHTRLVPLEPAHAALIAAWPRSADEAYRWSPRSQPPITPETIARWGRPGHEQHCLVDASSSALLAYGELNVLDLRSASYWLGHLIVDPQRRGQHVGVQLTRALVRRAFQRYAARRVCLVVFSENAAAIGCYRSAGFRDDGYEPHDFPAYGRCELMLRMSIDNPW